MQIVTHWWGIEVIFTKAEKEKLISVVDISGGGAAVGALAEALELMVVSASGPVLAVLAAVIALIAAQLAVCDLVGKGGFRICITWLVITLPPPLGTVTLAPMPVF